MYKNNTDFHGHSYGCHDNYLVSRNINFENLVRGLLPFLVSRQLIAGAGDDVVVGVLTPDKLEQSSGRRYLKARRPELYRKLVEPQESVTMPGWRMEHESDDRDAASAE